MATASIKRIPFDSKTSTAACRMSPPQEQDNSDSPSNTSELTTGKAEESDSRQRATKRQSLRIKTHEGMLLIVYPYAHVHPISQTTPAPTKPKRKRISQEQFQALSELFEQTDTPNYELREKLAHKLNMTNREVQVCIKKKKRLFVGLPYEVSCDPYLNCCVLTMCTILFKTRFGSKTAEPK